MHNKITRIGFKINMNKGAILGYTFILRNTEIILRYVDIDVKNFIKA